MADKKNDVKEKNVKKKTDASKKATTTTKKAVSTKKATAKTNKKASVSKKNSASKKSTTSKKSASSNTKRNVASKNTSSKVSNSKKVKSTAKPMLAEYYDLPYRYNQTIVKILAQTPTTLFVYWDISDEDRNTLISKHGESFFYETKPILIVHNTTKNYSFEIEINDFANSWYIRTQEPNCNYIIELGRKNLNKPEEYIYIDSSNNIISPNDHILFEKSDLGNVLFKNVKTNTLSSKNFGSLRFINDIDKLYGNLYDVYSRLYNDNINEFANPSSDEFIKK